MIFTQMCTLLDLILHALAPPRIQDTELLWLQDKALDLDDIEEQLTNHISIT